VRVVVRRLTRRFALPGAAHAAALLALLLAACTPSYRQYDLIDQALPCDDGNRLAYRTLTAMRFQVGALQPATAEQSGVITASRPRSSTGDVQEVTVIIECRPQGVTLLASEGGGWVQQADFKRAFHHAFLNVRSTRDTQTELDARMIAGTAPASMQRRDLRVVVQPMPGQASKLDFPFDLDAAGVLLVYIDVTNLSPRAYTLAPDEIRLMRADRGRAAPLPPADAAARVAASTTLPAATVAAMLERRLFVAMQIPPGAQRDGYLYFPLAPYVSARIVFTDSETGEPEGVRVEF
jgi:hypothetical protein